MIRTEISQTLNMIQDVFDKDGNPVGHTFRGRHLKCKPDCFGCLNHEVREACDKVAAARTLTEARKAMETLQIYFEATRDYRAARDAS